MVDIIICLVIGVCVVAAITYIVRVKINAKKNGTCSCGCSGCSCGCGGKKEK